MRDEERVVTGFQGPEFGPARRVLHETHPEGPRAPEGPGHPVGGMVLHRGYDHAVRIVGVEVEGASAFVDGVRQDVVGGVARQGLALPGVQVDARRRGGGNLVRDAVQEDIVNGDGGLALVPDLQGREGASLDPVVALPAGVGSGGTRHPGLLRVRVLGRKGEARVGGAGSLGGPHKAKLVPGSVPEGHFDGEVPGVLGGHVEEHAVRAPEGDGHGLRGVVDTVGEGLSQGRVGPEGCGTLAHARVAVEGPGGSVEGETGVEYGVLEPEELFHVLVRHVGVAVGFRHEAQGVGGFGGLAPRIGGETSGNVGEGGEDEEERPEEGDAGGTPRHGIHPPGSRWRRCGPAMGPGLGRLQGKSGPCRGS